MSVADGVKEPLGVTGCERVPVRLADPDGDAAWEDVGDCEGVMNWLGDAELPGLTVCVDVDAPVPVPDPEAVTLCVVLGVVTCDGDAVAAWVLVLLGVVVPEPLVVLLGVGA